MAKKVKVQYNKTCREPKAWSTDREVWFQVEINGVKANGRWNAVFNTITNGVDVNELFLVEGGCIKIYEGGSGYRFYHIAVHDLPLHKSQPKSLQFTGPRIDISILKKTFVSMIEDSIANPDKRPKLSEQFLKTFKLI